MTTKEEDPPRTKKERTHQRIVGVAARLFRKHGYDATGVDTLMGEAELTRGGFYAHFRDKAGLFAEALDHAFDESTENLLARGLEALRGEAWAARAAERYLDMAHRDRPASGCAVPALGAEVARAPRGVRARFTRRASLLVELVAERLAPEGADAKARAHARREAIAMLARWAGAMLLARAVDDRTLAEEILRAAR